jgi:hypothetical protein
MKKDLVLMTATGVPLERIREIVQSTNYQGFPVVRSDEDKTIIGFVRKTELRYALGQLAAALCIVELTNETARQGQGICLVTPCARFSASRPIPTYREAWWITRILSYRA